MNPYYSDDSVELFLGDCREVLADIADRSVDCVITDPPYSERTHSNAKTNRGGNGVRAVAFTSMTDSDVRRALGECGRLSRRWVIATLDYRDAFAYEADPPPYLRLLRIGVWVKPNPMPQISADRPAMGWEPIAFLHRNDGKPSWHGGGRAANWIRAVSQGEGHPTAKPLGMVADWVRLFTDPGDLILDPFAGSGTTLRAAKDEGRRAIGVEIDERYCEIAARRLGQDTLFGASA